MTTAAQEKDGATRKTPIGGAQVFRGGQWVDAETEPGKRARRRPAGRLGSLTFTGDELGRCPAPPRVWQVHKMVPARNVTLLQADGGLGKSILALQLGVATVTGRPWLGQEVRRGNAVYFSCEDDKDEIHRRLEAITADGGIGFDDLAGLKILDLTGQETVIAGADRNGRLTPTEVAAELEDVITEWQPRLVVIDNLADVFAGEENSRPQARQFIALLQGWAARNDAAVLLIGHPSLAGIASGSGSSGSTAWNNSVRSRLYLQKPRAEDGTAPPSDLRILSVMKANYAASGAELRLRWQAGAFVLEDGGSAMTAVEREIADQRVDRLFLELLTAYRAEGRSVGNNPGHSYAPALFARDHRGKGATKSGFVTAMNRLFAAGEIVVEEEGPPSRRTRRLARVQKAEGS